MNQESINIKTPEYVSLQFQLAGLGSRTAAFIIDQLIITAVNILILILLVFSLGGFSQITTVSDEISSVSVAIALILVFLISWGYFFIFEYFSAGRTIGKKAMGIRVIQENGHSITLLSSFIRNLLRIIDSLPVYYLLGILMIFFHGQHKRIGDLVAGTIVVHERKTNKKRKLSPIEKEIARRGLSKEDLSLDEWSLKAIGEKEWKLLQTYSQRLLELEEFEKIRLSQQVADILLPKLGLDASGKNFEGIENMLLVLYLLAKEEWEYQL